MINVLTFVSLGLLQIGGTQVVTVVDPATADVADIDAAVREYAVASDQVASDKLGESSSSENYRSDEPHPPVPPGQPSVQFNCTLGSTPVAVDKPQNAGQLAEEFDLEGLKLDKPFVVLREVERPEWVEQPPQLKGDGEHFISVASDPWKTDFEASESLDKKLRTAVNDYINDQIGRTDAAQRIRLSPETLDQLVDRRYVEDLQFADTSIGAMKQIHAHLVFTPQFRAEIAERWKEHVVNARLLRTGMGAAGVLVLMVMAFGVLKRLGRR